MKRVIVVLMLLSIAISGADFNLKNCRKITVNGVAIDQKTVKKIDQMLQAGSKTTVEIYSKPDFELSCDQKDRKQIYAIFFKENVIYPGDYLDAWGERMRGRSSNCLKLTPGFKKWLEQKLRKLQLIECNKKYLNIYCKAQY